MLKRSQEGELLGLVRLFRLPLAVLLFATFLAYCGPRGDYMDVDKLRGLCAHELQRSGLRGLEVGEIERARVSRTGGVPYKLGRSITYLADGDKAAVCESDGRRVQLTRARPDLW